MKNHCKSTVSSILALLLAFCAGAALAEEPSQLPPHYKDDLYHCRNPADEKNVIPCNPTTYRWELDALQQSTQPDDSLTCQELVKILVRARENADLDSANLQANQIQDEVQLWETIMETSVVDRLEPCVIWAITYGPLMPWASSMGYDYDDSELGSQHFDITDNSDPLSSMLEIEFDPIYIALAWDNELPETLTLDRTELHDLTGRHILDALKAELGPDKIAHLDLTVTAGLPVYEPRILPLTLSGKVVFSDHREALGASNLHKLILQTAFVDGNAQDLYLFRLKIAEDPTLQMVHTVVAGRDSVSAYILQEPDRKYSGGSHKNTSSMPEEDEGFVSTLLAAILSAVGTSILAVVCFAYFLIFRARTSGKAAKALDEYSSSTSASNRKGFKNNKAYPDDVPNVKTAPTDEEQVEEESQYDIEYAVGSHDGVSEYDMETLPPPTSLPDTDDDQSHVMSVMEGFDDENANQEAPANTQSDDSDATASLYSYIPDDTSLTMSLAREPTALERVQQKGVLWSVERQQDAPGESDMSDYEFSTGPSFDHKKNRKSMLGPSDDDDSLSRDSNNLFYGTDDDDELVSGPPPGHKVKEMPVSYDEDAAPPTHQYPPVVESSSAEQDSGDKKKKFEDLWKDENEIDEAASVLNYLDSVQSARRAAQNEIEAPPTISLKIIDVATPVQTPERPLRGDVNDIDVLESLVDMVPPTNESFEDEDNEMTLPLPTALDAVSVSSSLSGSSNLKKPRRVAGESARKKKPNKWNASSPSVASSGSSVCSTDSSKLRKLLGQGDVNDAALVFGKREAPQKDDSSLSSGNSNSEVSMSSCTSGKLKSLLTTDANSDDEPEDFLFTDSHKTELPAPRRTPDEEKKENDCDSDDDDEDDRRNQYLPAAITPRGLPPTGEFNSIPDDSTVHSALSAAPSVDVSVKSDMGWF